MFTSLIDRADEWDAAQIISRAQQQVWDEILAVECPELDDTRDVIPQPLVARVFDSAAYRLLDRVSARLRQAA